MQALDKDLRGALEKTVKSARETAEIAAFAALDQLGVGHDKPEAFLSDAEKALRNRLRTHGKQLGDARDSKSTNPTYGKQEVQHLAQEVAYQHWHRMLFARFLADNDLLMYDGVAVTIEECDELAADEGAKNGWELAGKLAARMLPQVFKPGSPVFELTFAPEHQSELERLLKTLPDAVFKASDSLGWVYQFWQADNKERINKSEVKIGADELPAVTQLFTEPYMVAFLLHNSLGAWWVTRHPGAPCPVDLTYLRFAPNKDGSNAVPPAPTFEWEVPAAGKYEGWPDSLTEFKLLDPCCGSGHFLVAAFLMLVPMRIAAEGLSAKVAVDRVLAENIHGLELDPRCVEIAVFAVALEAWRYPDASGKPLGVREIPAPNIACCGLKVAGKAQDWEALVPNDAPNAEYVRQELRHLHASFAQAPLLGSLLDPSRSLKNDLATSSYETLTVLLHKALTSERSANLLNEDGDRWELALSAQGLLEAARVLDARYDLVITNVPYLKSGNHSDNLRSYLEVNYPCSVYDLATVFMERCLELTKDGCHSAIVTQQYWLFLKYYESLREKFIKNSCIDLLAILGPGAFATIGGEVVNPCLQIYSKRKPDNSHLIRGLDVTRFKKAFEKSDSIQSEEILSVLQSQQKHHPNSRISLSKLTIEGESPLSTVADFGKGSVSGDGPHYLRYFWEVSELAQGYRYWLNSPDQDDYVGGRQNIVLWNVTGHDLTSEAGYAIRGQRVWGKKGIAIGKAGKIRPTLYNGELFDDNLAVIVPFEQKNLQSLWNFCISQEFELKLKQLDKKMSVTAGTFTKVSVDLALFDEDLSSESLPDLQTSDPTQWLFHGNPADSTAPLQVAVARLLGYTWPSETDDKMEMSDEARAWVARSKALANHADKDGIVCIPPVGQEASASDRLLNLLADAYRTEWNNDVLAQLLTASDHAGKSLETWLRDKFFIQHCALFGNRPFVWHVWDGLRDGFSALVNYHKLDYKTLEALIYTYLGDWISRQKRDADNGVDGAQEKLAAAEVLKKRLELILAGEAPYDIFVRWKPIDEQPIGWNPDLNDGVRLNIRPFLSVPDVGKRDAGVLRDKPKGLHWEKDRGSDVPSAPWYKLGLQNGSKVGDRINDHHLSLAEKRAAREKTK